MSTWPIFGLCAQDIGFEGVERLQLPWWGQKAAEDQMRVLVEAILTAERVRRK